MTSAQFQIIDLWEEFIYTTSHIKEILTYALRRNKKKQYKKRQQWINKSLQRQ